MEKKWNSYLTSEQFIEGEMEFVKETLLNNTEDQEEQQKLANLEITGDMINEVFEDDYLWETFNETLTSIIKERIKE